MRLHWGTPSNQTKLRAWTGSICPKPNSGGVDYDNRFTDHAITRWYGVSFGLSGFLGWFKFGKTTYPSERGPLPSLQDSEV